jgi:GTP-binding protein EngB required for normal cell division
VIKHHYRVDTDIYYLRYIYAWPDCDHQLEYLLVTTMNPTENVSRNKVHVVLVGNPGTGKSTILNSLCGEVRFRSGVSIGRGMTNCLQFVEYDDKVYADTPGLSDINLREQAAREIERLFRTVLRMKLIFVISLESGRIRPDDLTTMQLVLDALGVEDLTNRFAIIINKLTKPVRRALEDPWTRARLFECLNSATPSIRVIRRQTQFIELLSRRLELEDSNNVLVDPDPALVHLVARMPPVQVIEEDVRAIDVHSMETRTAQFEEMISSIMAANEVQVEAMMKQQADMQARMMEIVDEKTSLEVKSARLYSEAQNALAEAQLKAEQERSKLEHDYQEARLRNELERRQLQARFEELLASRQTYGHSGSRCTIC